MLEIIAAAIAIKLISKYALDYPGAMEDITDDKLHEQYNGVGPANWPEKKREALSDVFKPYEICVIIHDICQAQGVPAPVADEMLWNNLKKVWAKDFGPLRWFKPQAIAERKTVLPQLYKILTENRDA